MRAEAVGGAARVASFRLAEAVVGLVVSLAAAAVSIPGTVTRVPTESAVLLLPLAGMVVYGVLILTGRPRRGDALAPLTSEERRLVRRQTVGWGVVIVVAVLVPPEWVWPNFVAGLIGFVYSIRQLRQQLSSRRRRD